MTYVSGINHGKETEIVRHRFDSRRDNKVFFYNLVNHGKETEIVRHRFDSRRDNKVFFYNLVIMYWTLNSIYMQFG